MSENYAQNFSDIFKSFSRESFSNSEKKRNFSLLLLLHENVNFIKTLDKVLFLLLTGC